MGKEEEGEEREEEEGRRREGRLATQESEPRGGKSAGRVHVRQGWLW